MTPEVPPSKTQDSDAVGSTGAPLDATYLLTQTLVTRCELHPSLDSTNDRARQLAPTLVADEVLLVAAEQQSAGRGRGANRWWTGSGSLAISLLIDVQPRGILRQHAGLISLAMAKSVVQAIAPRVPAQPVGLHWPNDVYIGSRKLAGILVESLPDARCVVGLGLNVNNSASEAPPPLDRRVVSLLDATATLTDRTQLLAEILNHFDSALTQLATAPLELGATLNGCCLQHGRCLTIHVGAEQATGMCLGIAADGALRLMTPQGERRFHAGVLHDPSIGESG